MLFAQLSLAEEAIVDLCPLKIRTCTLYGCTSGIIIDISLEIRDESVEPYSRNLFLSRNGGAGWEDTDGDCKDTRTEVLEQTSLIQPVMSESGCKVFMGLWYDPYSNTLFELASELDIDHVVPLKEAHESGASVWDENRRGDFGNDYKKTGNLIAVWNSLNRSKGSKEPYEWLPPNEGYYCEYTNRWAYIKWFWGLTVDQKECDTLKKLISCN